MITFLDGPAVDARLNLARTPRFLRVVVDQDGTVDALDQLTDTPRPTEAIYVYRLASMGDWVIYCTRGQGCHRAVSATYKLYPQQPTDDEARDAQRWAAWAMRQHESEGGK